VRIFPKRSQKSASSATGRDGTPRDVRLLLHMADALAAQGQRAESIERLREAIRLRPDFWEPRYLLGVELTQQDKISEALEEFKAVVRLRPDYAPAHFNLAVALAKQGQLADAARQFGETVRLDPDHQAARKYLEQLQAVLPAPAQPGP
jgi:Flp pilus assembly protein TadD